MSAGSKKKLTEAEYLAIERAAEFKSEFFNGEMFAMAGATYDHNRIKDNLASVLNSRLAGGPCFALTSDMKVKVSKTGLYAYPDIVILCGEPQFGDGSRDTILNPAVVIEVLSPSTEKYDRGAKFRQYQKLESLNEYVLVSQDEPICERFVRQPDDSWMLTSATGLAAELCFGTVPVRVALAAIYEGVVFPDAPVR
ncbi:MAG: uncharacterized protein JWO38_1704 [Gemmataceae bacterium]|nr:uncharacterized protein [Gemmataceae bacterium]